jgi:hypothetical protein
MMIRTRFTLAFLAALWLAAPSLAYTVYLKDGAKLIAKEPP